MNAPALKRFTFLVSFRNGETCTVTYTDTDPGTARELAWKLLPGKDQDRKPLITLLTTAEAQS